jgi:hypothetical protein
MNRRHRAFVTRIHRLQHIKRFLAATFTNYNAVRTHAKGILHEFALPNLAFTFRIGRARFQPANMGLLQL